MKEFSHCCNTVIDVLHRGGSVTYHTIAFSPQAVGLEGVAYGFINDLGLSPGSGAISVFIDGGHIRAAPGKDIVEPEEPSERFKGADFPKELYSKFLLVFIGRIFLFPEPSGGWDEQPF